MESLSEHFRDPLSAALIAGLITAGYIHLKAHLNNEGKLELNKCDTGIFHSFKWFR